MCYVIIIIFFVALDLLDLYVISIYAKRQFYFSRANEANEISKEYSGGGSANGKKSVIKRYLLGWIRFKLRQLGKVPSHHIRKFILKKVYRMKIGENAVIYGGFEIRSPWNIEIGKGTIIGDESKLDGRHGIIIGDNVNFSTGVWIWTEQHDLNDSKFGVTNKGGKVIIENRAWLSTRTTILPKTTIGEGSVVAAGAIITKDCEPFGIYGGVPAKKIGERNRNLEYEFDGKYCPFF